MVSVLIAVAGLCGTLAAVVLTARTQRAAAERASQREHDARMRDERITVLSTFAANLVDYRRAELHAWHQVEKARVRGDTIDFDDAPQAEVMRQVRSAAWAHLYHLRLLWGNPEIVSEAESLIHRTSEIEHADTNEDAKAVAKKVREDIGVLIDKAREELGH